MARWIELVELRGGETVAVEFTDDDAATAFGDHINAYGSKVPVDGGRGGMRLLTVVKLAKELGISPTILRPAKEA